MLYACFSGRLKPKVVDRQVTSAFLRPRWPRPLGNAPFPPSRNETASCFPRIERKKRPPRSTRRKIETSGETNPATKWSWLHNTEQPYQRVHEPCGKGCLCGQDNLPDRSRPENHSQRTVPSWLC